MNTINYKVKCMEFIAISDKKAKKQEVLFAQKIKVKFFELFIFLMALTRYISRFLKHNSQKLKKNLQWGIDKVKIITIFGTYKILGFCLTI